MITIERKYGAATTINFPLYLPDGSALKVDAVSVAGDIKIMKDEGAEANTATTTFTDEGQGYSLPLGIAELQAARIVIYIVDQTAAQTWLDQVIIIETYGHASAEHAVDRDDSVRSGMTALPAAAADAAGGLPVSDAGGLDLDAEANSAVFTDAATLVDLIWDEGLTGATHNVATSAGRRLRELASASLQAGTAQAGSSDTITLEAGASGTDGLYVGCGVVIDDGTGAGQSRYIIGYNGTTKVATVARPWTTSPDATSDYVVLADNQIDYLQMGLAAAGGATSITLDANASATDDIYKAQCIRVFGGTGKYQVRRITAYNGTTKVATVDRAWQTNPDSTSYYAVLGVNNVNLNDLSAADVNAEVDTALNTAIPGAPTAGSVNDVLADLDARLPGSGTISILDAAAVNAEVVDVIDTDTSAELAAVPAANSSLRDRIGWIFALARNKITQTATVQSLRNDTDAGNIATANVSDDGTTAVRDEFS